MIFILRSSWGVMGNLEKVQNRHSAARRKVGEKTKNFATEPRYLIIIPWNCDYSSLRKRCFAPSMLILVSPAKNFSYLDLSWFFFLIHETFCFKAFLRSKFAEHEKLNPKQNNLNLRLTLGFPVPPLLRYIHRKLNQNQRERVGLCFTPHINQK